MTSQLQPPAKERLEDFVPQALRELADHRTDGPALNHLGEALLGPLRAFMSEKGWGLEDPEQAASEALSLILSILDKYDNTRGSLMGWVWGVARNHLRGLLRRLAQRNEAHLKTTKYESKHAEKHHLASLTRPQRAMLLLEVVELAEEDYQLLFLLFREQKDATEVSAILGLSPDSVRQRKRRLIARLEDAHRSAMTAGKI